MPSLKHRAALANLCLLRLQILGGRATAREIADDLGKAVEIIQPRFSDLFNDGRIRDTGLRVRGGRGRPQVVWADSNTDADDDYLHFETPADFIAAGGTAPVTLWREPALNEEADEPTWFSKFGQ